MLSTPLFFALNCILQTRQACSIVVSHDAVDLISIDKLAPVLKEELLPFSASLVGDRARLIDVNFSLLDSSPPSLPLDAAGTVDRSEVEQIPIPDGHIVTTMTKPTASPATSSRAPVVYSHWDPAMIPPNPRFKSASQLLQLTLSLEQTADDLKRTLASEFATPASTVADRTIRSQSHYTKT